MINIALIGAGHVVRKSYLPAIENRTDCKIVGICSQKGDRASELASRYDIEHVFTKYKDAIKHDSVNAVFICTPTHLHQEMAEMAMDHDKHILVEKPLCTSYENTHHLLRRAQKYPNTFYVTFNNQFRPENAWLKTKVLAGDLGNIELIDMEWYRKKMDIDKPWLFKKTYSGGGVLIDLGIHLVHFAVSMISERQSFCVYCKTISHKLPGSDVEDTAISMITINDNTSVQIKLGWNMELDRRSRVKIEVFGNNGHLANHQYIGEEVDPFSRLIDDFIYHIKMKTKPDLSLINDSMLLIDSMYRSSLSNTLVEGKFDL